MRALIYVVIITSFVALSSILSAISKIINREKKGLKKVTGIGWIFFTLNLVIVFLSALQYWQNEIDIKQKEEDSSKKQLVRDSLLRNQYDSSLYVMKEKYDTSNRRIVTTIANVLGTYGYRLDSSNQRLERLIKDSAKTRVILSDDPVFIICAQSGISLTDFKNGRDYYEISFCSEDAGSSQFDINCPIIISDSLNNYFYIGTLDFLTKDTKIPKGLTYKGYFNFPYTNPYSFLYILVKGTYKNIEGTKHYQVNNLYYYNRQGNTSGVVLGKTKASILQYINSITN